MYQLYVFAFAGVGAYAFSFPFTLTPIYTDQKLAADPSLQGFTMEFLSYASSALFLGWAAGAAASGPAVEQWGRKIAVFGTLAGLVASGLVALAAPSLFPGPTGQSIYIGAKFVGGFFVAFPAIAGVFVQEFLPGHLRGKCMAGLNAAYSIGAAAQAALCGTVTRTMGWQLESFLWYIPAFAAVLFGVPLVGESLRLLVARGRLDEAHNLLARIAKTNGVEEAARGVELVVAKDVAGDAAAVDGGAEGSAQQSLFSKEMFPRAIALATCFAACSMTFYGLSYSAGALSPDLYTNSVLLNLVDLLGYAMALGVDYFGRRATQGVCFLISGVCLLLCGVLQPGSWAIISCALVGRLCVDACYTVVYILIVELFPTSCRSGATGLCLLAARLGGLFAPLCRDLPAAISCPIFGAMCLLSALLTFSLPETTGTKAD